jgi:hypothetical protein
MSRDNPQSDDVAVALFLCRSPIVMRLLRPNVASIGPRLPCHEKAIPDLRPPCLDAAVGHRPAEIVVTQRYVEIMAGDQPFRELPASPALETSWSAAEMGRARGDMERAGPGQALGDLLSITTRSKRLNSAKEDQAVDGRTHH